jgi:hypothetical protein
MSFPSLYTGSLLQWGAKGKGSHQPAKPSLRCSDLILAGSHRAVWNVGSGCELSVRGWSMGPDSTLAQKPFPTKAEWQTNKQVNRKSNSPADATVPGLLTTVLQPSCCLVSIVLYCSYRRISSKHVSHVVFTTHSGSLWYSVLLFGSP